MNSPRWHLGHQREILAGHASDSVYGQTYTLRDAIPITLLQMHVEKLIFRTA
jgi:hypothetical protein